MPPVYDVVLLPPHKVNRQSIETSNALRDLGTRFTLDESTAVPHVSLYMANIQDKDLGKAAQALARVAKQTTPLELTAQRYGNNEHGMFEVFYDKTPEIVRLQESVIAAVDPVRDGLRELDPVGRSIADRIAEASGELRQNFDRCGYDEVGGFFNPHITLTRLSRPEHAPDSADLPSERAFSGNFSRLALYRMGDHGTCVDHIGEWRTSGERTGSRTLSRVRSLGRSAQRDEAQRSAPTEREGRS